MAHMRNGNSSCVQEIWGTLIVDVLIMQIATMKLMLPVLSDRKQLFVSSYITLSEIKSL